MQKDFSVNIILNRLEKFFEISSQQMLTEEDS